MKFRIYSLVIGLFILGVVSGVLLTLGVAKHQIRSITSSSTPEIASLVGKFLDRRLNLSAEQEKAISEVLVQGEQDALPIRREFRQKMLGIIKTYHPQINNHLEEPQQRELDQIVEKLLATWQLAGDPDLPTKN